MPSGMSRRSRIHRCAPAHRIHEPHPRRARAPERGARHDHRADRPERCGERMGHARHGLSARRPTPRCTSFSRCRRPPRPQPRLERGGAIIAEEVVRGATTRRRHRDARRGQPLRLRRDVDRPVPLRRSLAGRRITGHTAAQTGESLWGYLAAGVGDDHNSSTVDEVLERTRLGAHDHDHGVVAHRQHRAALRRPRGDRAGASQPRASAPTTSTRSTSRIEGHIDHHVRQAIRFGVDPQLAYRMATVIPRAHYYRTRPDPGRHRAVAPRRPADHPRPRRRSPLEHRHRRGRRCRPRRSWRCSPTRTCCPIGLSTPCGSPEDARPAASSRSPRLTGAETAARSCDGDVQRLLQSARSRRSCRSSMDGCTPIPGRTC